MPPGTAPSSRRRGRFATVPLRRDRRGWSPVEVAQNGEDPACVATCPAHAMHFGLLDDPTSTVSRLLAEREHYVLSPETGNQPNVFYLR